MSELQDEKPGLLKRIGNGIKTIVKGVAIIGGVALAIIIIPKPILFLLVRLALPVVGVYCVVMAGLSLARKVIKLGKAADFLDKVEKEQKAKAHKAPEQTADMGLNQSPNFNDQATVQNTADNSQKPKIANDDLQSRKRIKFKI